MEKFIVKRSKLEVAQDFVSESTGNDGSILCRLTNTIFSDGASFVGW